MGLFKDTTKDLLISFANEVSGEYVEVGKTKKTVVIPHEGFQICFDFYTVSTGNTYTVYARFRTLIKTYHPFTFRIVKQGFFQNIAKIFGHEDIEINDPEFDDMFVISSNNPPLIQKVLVEGVKYPLLCYPRSVLELKTKTNVFESKLKPNEALIEFLMPSNIRDTKPLKELLGMQKALIDAMKANDCIY